MKIVSICMYKVFILLQQYVMLGNQEDFSMKGLGLQASHKYNQIHRIDR